MNAFLWYMKAVSLVFLQLCIQMYLEDQFFSANPAIVSVLNAMFISNDEWYYRISLSPHQPPSMCNWYVYPTKNHFAQTFNVAIKTTIDNTIEQNGIIDFHPKLRNVLMVNGFSGHGSQHAPAAGRAAAELLDSLDHKFWTMDLDIFSSESIAITCIHMLS